MPNDARRGEKSKAMRRCNRQYQRNGKNKRRRSANQHSVAESKSKKETPPILAAGPTFRAQQQD
jgi:hypothetical protein